MDKAMQEAVERIGKELWEQLRGAEPVDRWELRPTGGINPETGEAEKKPAHVVNHVRLMPDDILLACRAAKADKVVSLLKLGSEHACKNRPVIIQAVHARHLLDQVAANTGPVASPSDPAEEPVEA